MQAVGAASNYISKVNLPSSPDLCRGPYTEIPTAIWSKLAPRFAYRTYTKNSCCPYVF